LAVRYVSDESQVLSVIRDALTAGRCVCWMRNTVADALAAHAHFRDELPLKADSLPCPLHPGDRLATEEQVLSVLAKAAMLRGGLESW
jgi:CRISPR-associated endonuclease/helicase Cas3